MRVMQIVFEKKKHFFQMIYSRKNFFVLKFGLSFQFFFSQEFFRCVYFTIS